MKDVVWSDNAFISKPNVCFSYSVCLVVIGCMVTSRNRKDKYSLSIFLFSCKDEAWSRRDSFFDESAYVLRILLRICQSYDVVGIINTKEESSASCVCKSTDALEPAFWLFYFKCFFEIANSRLCFIIWLSFGFLNYRKENFMYRALILDPIRIPSDYFFLINNILI